MNRAGRGYTFEVLRARVLFGHNRRTRKQKIDGYSLPEPAKPLMAAEPGLKPPKQESPRTRLLREQKNRCSSCKGVYESQDLHVTRMGPLLEGEPMVSLALLCTDCKDRFHTGEAEGEYAVSTR
jgi:hypothetical protein